MKQLRHKGKFGQTITLKESDDLFIVRTVNLYDPLPSLTRLGQNIGIENIEEHDVFPEASVFLYSIKEKASIEKINELKEQVKELEDPNIRFIGSIYKNQYNQYQIYTGNLFIKFENGITKVRINEIFKDYNLIEKNELSFAEGAYFIQAPDEIGREIFELSIRLLDLREVELCHPEIVVKRKSIEFKNPIDTPENNNDWMAEMIDLRKAWEVTKGKGVKICIIDDGIDLLHPAFSSKSKVLKSIDMFGDKSSRGNHKHSSEMHGTACASIAASNDDRAKGIAPEAELLVVRTKGLGSVLEAEAIRWAADEGADIISCSWGPSDGQINDPSDDHYQHLIPDHTRLALNYAASKGREGKGCLIFFAAGNGNEPVKNDGYASNDNVMAIGSVNKDRKPSKYSDRGYPLFCTFPSSDIIMQGDNYIQTYGLVTADRIGLSGYSETNYFSSFGGTSASCPGVAGVAALMLSIMPELRRSEAKTLLESSCIHPKGETTISDTEYGHGIINANKLVQNTLVKLKQRNPDMSQKTSTKTRALHIALNYVDANVYKSQLRLNGCENDAAFYSSLCTTFDSNVVIKNEEATRVGVTSAIEKLIQLSKTGDYVFITYAGHGSLLSDISGDEIIDQKDETLVLFDGILIDDEINNLLAKFGEGVNVIWISDSCHSGSNTRMYGIEDTDPDMGKRYASEERIQRVFESNRSFYEKELSRLPQPTRGVRDSLIEIKANLLTIAACKDDQYAGDLPQNGLFTGKLRQLRSQQGELSYARIIELATEELPLSKQPVITKRGTSNHSLDQEIFFIPNNITAKGGSEDDIVHDPQQEQTIFTNDNIIIANQGRSNKILINRKGKSRSKDKSTQYYRISQGTIQKDRTRNDINAWDTAYRLMKELENSDDLEYAEPDVVSAINGDPEEFGQNRSGDYIDTYPNPEDRNNQEPIVWHLDNDHSELRKAFKRATQKEEKVGGLTEQTKDTFPLIAHIDTGILSHHPTTPPNYREDLSEGFGNPIDKDKIFGFIKGETQGHGHATATILAGDKLDRGHSDNTYKGFLGAFPYAQVASLRISDTVVLLSGKKFAEAVYYAVDKIKADVITMSMAGAPTLRMLKAVNYAYENGVLIVCAGGNKWSKGIKKHLPDTIMYPARFQRVIGVTGATYDDVPYLIESNRDWQLRAEGGKYMETCHGPRDVMNNIIAAYTPNITWASKDKNQGIFVKTGGGTSSATPQVAAAAALWLHYHKDALDKIPEDQKWKRVEAVKKALFKSAKEDYQYVFGNGILRADQALDITPTSTFLKELSKAPEDRLDKGWLKGLLNMFNGRSISAQNDKLQEMLSTEIEQLIMTQPELKTFQTEIKNERDLKIALFKNKNSSRYLKELLSIDEDIISITGSMSTRSNGDFDYYSKVFPLPKDSKEKEHIILTSSAGPLKAIYRNYQHSENHLGTIEVGISQTRGATSPLTFRLPENKGLSYLLCSVGENGKKQFSWVYPGHKNWLNSNRSINQEEGDWVITIDTHTNRGFIGRIKKLFVNVFRVATSESPSPLKELVFYDSSQNNGTWKEVDHEAEKLIKKQKKVLFLCHGLFSSSESAFCELLKNKTFIKSIKEKGYGDYILGYNMPTITTGIATNANNLSTALKDYDLSKFGVIAHSRGCLVAREEFDADTQMVLTAGPHLGTPMARQRFIDSLLDSFTTMTISALGIGSPILSLVPKVLSLLFNKRSMTGITDMSDEEKYVESLNRRKELTQNQTVIGTDFDAYGWTLLLDKALDVQIFDREENDVAVPYNSSLSIGVGNPIRDTSFGNSSTHHLQYFENQQIIESIIEGL